MKSTLEFIIYVIFVAITLAIGGCNKPMQPQTSAATPEKPVTKASKIGSSDIRPRQTNFDPLSSTITPGFIPSDQWETVKALRKLPIAKDPYEKTADYLKRMGELGNSILYDNVKLNGFFAFKVAEHLCKFSYNPDAEELTYELNTILNYPETGISISFRAANEEGEGISGETNQSNSSQEGTQIVRREHICVDCDKKDRPFTAGPSIESYIGRIKLTPGEAKTFDKKISILLIGKILPPYLKESVAYPEKGPSYIVVDYVKKLPFQLESIWVVNDITGEVLSKKITTKRM